MHVLTSLFHGLGLSKSHYFLIILYINHKDMSLRWSFENYIKPNDESNKVYNQSHRNNKKTVFFFLSYIENIVQFHRT